MRYVVRWSNGLWRVLDLHEYVEVGVFGMKKTADQAAEEANLEEFAVPAHRVISKASR
jgi:hypothetical protein